MTCTFTLTRFKRRTQYFRLFVGTLTLKKGPCDWVGFLFFQSHSHMRHNDFLSLGTETALALIQMAVAVRAVLDLMLL